MLSTYRMLLELMTSSDRRRFWFLVCITFGLSFLEAASILSILPFLRLLAEPELIQTVPALSWIYNTFGFDSANGFLIAAGTAVFSITIVGLGTKMLTIWLTTRFALMRSYSFSSRLLANYLHQPYEWFLERHTADLGNAILSEVDRVVGGALLPAMRIIPETFTIVLLTVALCFVEPGIAIGGAVLLGGTYSIIFIAVRRILTRLGKLRLEASRNRHHVLQEATGGVKELKIMGLESGFLTRFRHAAYQMAKTQTHSQVISALPRQGIEAVAFGGMIVLVLIMLARGDGNIAAIVPTLGLIAAVALRLIPALQQIYQRASMIKTTTPALEIIHRDLTKLSLDPIEDRQRRDARPSEPLRHALEVRDLTYRYSGTDRPALNGLNLTIHANTTVGIVGGTGAGKTTLIDIILGLLDAQEGDILIDGTPLSDENRRAWQKTLGYVPQTIFLTDGTIAENIAFGRTKSEIDMVRVEKAARTAALHGFVTSELSDGYDTLVGERGTRLSGGQRQRVGIARALYSDPAMLIFDEATSALDTLTEAAVMEAVQRLTGKKTVVMIAHRLTTVRDCDTIFLLQGGVAAAQGGFDDLVESNDAFRRMAAGLKSGSAP